MKRTLLWSGQSFEVVASAEADLLGVLQGSLKIGSVGRGCRDGGCGACRVLLDGALVNTCTLSLEQVRDGSKVETYEDLSGHPAAVSATRAFTKERPTRCMLCLPQVGVTAVYLARGGVSGERAAITKVLESASCTCTGRGSLRRALLAK